MTELELRERQKKHLASLLRIKRDNEQEVKNLRHELEEAVVGMEEEDVAVVERIIGTRVSE